MTFFCLKMIFAIQYPEIKIINFFLLKQPLQFSLLNAEEHILLIFNTN